MVLFFKDLSSFARNYLIGNLGEDNRILQNDSAISGLMRGSREVTAGKSIKSP